MAKSRNSRSIPPPESRAPSSTASASPSTKAAASSVTPTSTTWSTPALGSDVAMDNALPDGADIRVCLEPKVQICTSSRRVRRAEADTNVCPTEHQQTVPRVGPALQFGHGAAVAQLDRASDF